MHLRERIQYLFQMWRDKWLFHHFYLREYAMPYAPPSQTLLVMRLDNIGDAILWLDQAKEYRKHFPEHRIVLFHNAAWEDLASQLPWFDECIAFDRTRIGDTRYYASLLRTLNRYTYEKLYSPVYSRDFFVVDWFVHNIHATEKIGFRDADEGLMGAYLNRYYRKHAEASPLKAVADGYYTTLVPESPASSSELQRNADWVRHLWGHDYRGGLPVFPFPTPRPASAPETPYALFHMGASTLWRAWPVHKFAAVAAQLPMDTIVLCGSQQEATLAETFMQVSPPGKQIISLCGRTTLTELIGVVAHATVVLTNETATVHIAAATGTPCVCLLGGGHYGRFVPYPAMQESHTLPLPVTCADHSCFGCNWRCPHPLQEGKWKCIANIEVEEVVAALITILQK